MTKTEKNFKCLSCNNKDICKFVAHVEEMLPVFGDVSAMCNSYEQSAEMQVSLELIKKQEESRKKRLQRLEEEFLKKEEAEEPSKYIKGRCHICNDDVEKAVVVCDYCGKTICLDHCEIEENFDLNGRMAEIITCTDCLTRGNE